MNRVNDQAKVFHDGRDHQPPQDAHEKVECPLLCLPFCAHNEQLIIPYAMSDSRTALATVRLPDLLGRLLHDGP